MGEFIGEMGEYGGILGAKGNHHKYLQKLRFGAVKVLRWGVVGLSANDGTTSKCSG